MSIKKVVLVGDSVFDNGDYVGPNQDVVNQLNQRLSAEYNAELIAAADVRIDNTGDLDTLRGNLRTVLERAGAMGERQGSA